MKIGIITFYCSDNYGAMLQAYGLKSYVKSINDDTVIVPYAPPFLTGRHWFIPYYPFKSKRIRFIWTITGIKHNIQMGLNFFRQKKNMKKFRKVYLLDTTPIIKTIRGLKKLDYNIYIVGSDQIWNPDITFGLRKAYFGAFDNIHKKKVIAYAASLGGKELPQVYNNEMKHLLKSVDVISMREEAAIPYINNLTNKSVLAVSDPVFLIDAKQWERIEVKPQKKNYILVYDTENNVELNQYVKKLSMEKNLEVVQMKLHKAHDDVEFTIEVCAGPAEFLGYVHYADYVVTNSFHATAFSIIFHKSFVVFCHSSRNARLENVLTQCGLKNRIISKKQEMDIDEPMDWKTVEKKKENMVEKSKKFLEKSLFLKEDNDNEIIKEKKL